MMTNKIKQDQRTCPYNVSHLIFSDRFQTHLVKCRRSVPDLKYGTCMYNQTHHIPEPELRYHHEICQDRIEYDKFSFVPSDRVDKYPILPAALDYPTWDDDIEVPTYNPDEYCANNPILRNAKCYTQSAANRRKFRQEERQRMQELEGKEEPSTSQEGGSVEPRRPIKESEGVHNRRDLPEDDRLDVVQLMRKIALDSKTVVTPQQNIQGSTENARPKEDFPPLSMKKTRGNGRMNKPASCGRGRGQMK